MQKEVKFDITGLGNALVDSLVAIDDNLLHRHGISKGHMFLFEDKSEKQAVLDELKEFKATHCAGGSAANTITALAKLGLKVAFIGKIGNDEIGRVFRTDMNKAGVHYRTFARTDDTPTGRSAILVSPDAQRTMITRLGAARTISKEDIDLDVVKASKMIYLEGYLWNKKETKEAMRLMMETAYASKRDIALSLSDPLCVRGHREEFLKLIKDYVTLLFSNEEEIRELYQEQSTEAALDKVSRDCDLAVVTLGANGAVAVRGKDRIHVPAEKIENLIDTTGAGDMFAAGFLSKYLKGAPLEDCVKEGVLQASKIIQVMGARL